MLQSEREPNTQLDLGSLRSSLRMSITPKGKDVRTIRITSKNRENPNIKVGSLRKSTKDLGTKNDIEQM